MSPSRRPPRVSVSAPLAIFAVIALIIGLSFVLQRGWEPSASPDTATGAASGVAVEDQWRAERLQSVDRLAIGDPEAPAELVVFSDYQCPFCAHWDRDTLPELADYVEAGDLRIVWRNANLSGSASAAGSRAVYAAAMQGSLLEFHTALAQDPRGTPSEQLEPDALIALAVDLGLERARFAADMDSPEADRAVARGAAEAQRAGVTTAPSFLFNGEFVAGLKPTSTFITQIEAALTENATAITE